MFVRFFFLCFAGGSRAGQEEEEKKRERMRKKRKREGNDEVAEKERIRGEKLPHGILTLRHMCTSGPIKF